MLIKVSCRNLTTSAVCERDSSLMRRFGDRQDAKSVQGVTGGLVFMVLGPAGLGEAALYYRQSSDMVGFAAGALPRSSHVWSSKRHSVQVPNSRTRTAAPKYCYSWCMIHCRSAACVMHT